ncbi:uncharacterized protein [Euwallacea similis]|uniref:uncharacterized protein isoform X2 n=1 Tax=Euwallacea similis TaxID=1736056 RepID=UPI00344D45D3
MERCDRWTILRIIEVILVVACLIFKRVTDDEARSLSLYLQKRSREWSWLNNIIWDRVGSSVADATFGGYTIITVALLFGKIFGELPTRKRVMEWTFLFVGAVLFITIGSLAFASIESIHGNLIDNAAIMGTLALVTGALFLLDMGSPKKRKSPPPAQIQQVQTETIEVKKKLQEPDISAQTKEQSYPQKKSITEQVYDIEREVQAAERTTRIQPAERDERKKVTKEIKNNVIRNGEYRNGEHRNGDYRNGTAHKIETTPKSSPPKETQPQQSPSTRNYIGYKPMQEDEFDIPKRFGIYGKDVTDYGGDSDETASIPPKVELHTPVWSNIRKERVKKYYIPTAILPQRIMHRPNSLSDTPPSGPLDPGFVQYTAEHWDDRKRNGTKTPKTSPNDSPTDV